MQADWECDAISCELVETANETSETDISQRMDWHGTARSRVNQETDEARTQATSIVTFLFCEPRPGVFTLYDRQTVGSLSLTCKKPVPTSMRMALMWHEQRFQNGCSWMVPGMAAEHSGSQHAKHMWHHTRKHAAFDRQKHKRWLSYVVWSSKQMWRNT